MTRHRHLLWLAPGAFAASFSGCADCDLAEAVAYSIGVTAGFLVGWFTAHIMGDTAPGSDR